MLPNFWATLYVIRISLLSLQPSVCGTRSHLAFATLPLPIPSVVFLKLTVSSRLLAPLAAHPSASDSASGWHCAVCTLTIDLLPYLLRPTCRQRVPGCRAGRRRKNQPTNKHNGLQYLLARVIRYVVAMESSGAVCIYDISRSFRIFSVDLHTHTK